MSRIQGRNTLLNQYVPPFILDGEFQPGQTLVWDADLKAFVNSDAPFGAGTLNELTDVDTSGVQAGQALVFDGAEWVPGAFVSGGEVNTASNLGAGIGLFSAKVGVDLQFRSLTAGDGIALTVVGNEIVVVAELELDQLADVDLTGAMPGQVLSFDGTSWVPGTGGGFTGSRGETGFTGSAGADGDTGFTGSQGTGFTGSAGADGDTGFTGSQGIQGFTGSQGTQGDTGFVGSRGLDGFTGSVGFTGSQGDQGVAGFTGSVGFAGSQGAGGFTGSQGDQGFVGSRGDTGFVGSQGAQGDAGFVGSQGTQGFTGSRGADGTGITILGTLPDEADLPTTGDEVGDAYLIDGDLWVWDGAEWQNVGNIQGPAGDSGFTGSQGDQGDIGYTGSRGVDGFTGSQGDTGFTGSRGVDGFTGSQGDQGILGFTGSQGDQGDIGFTGSRGVDGFTGSQGSQGDQGGTGFVGSAGADGFTGSQGVAGFTGSQGTQGVIGFTGSRGVDGFTGSRGDTGFTGSRGVDGFTGSQGDQGPPGADGTGITILGTLPDEADLPTTGDEIGDAYLIDGDLWVWDGAEWQNVGNIQGPQGFTGSRGLVGFTGSQGDTGFTGSRGVDGFTGSVGFTGSRGVDGFTGSQGSIGFTGSQGDIGFTGSRGVDGFTGSQGDQGFTGSLGFVGSQGDLGFTGSQGAGADITVEDNVGLVLENDELSTIYNTLIADEVESITVGGASSEPASTWKTRSLVQVLDTILFPDVYPTYTIPTISASFSQSGTREIGSTISQNITTTGTKNDAGPFTRLEIRRGGTTIEDVDDPTGTPTTAIPDQFGYPNPNNPNFTYSLGTSDSFVVVAGGTTWNSRGNYDAGDPKQNNKGVVDDRTPAVRSVNAPQAAGTNFTSNSATVTGIYPYFWGVSASQPTASSIAAEIEAGTANKVLSSSTGTITITFNADSEYVWMAHAAIYTTKTKWFNTPLNQGDIGPGNFILAPVEEDVTSPDSYWNDISFEIYISDGPTVTSGAIEFRNN